MNIFTLEVFDDEGSRCVFYTVRLDGQELNETDKFFAKYEEDEVLGQALMDLAAFLFKKIAMETGASKYLFRFENNAQALPPAGFHKVGEVSINYQGFPLRLYCLRISDSLVVLFNGAKKTSQTAQSGETRTAFNEANRYAGAILKALSNGEISISGNGRAFLDGFGNENIDFFY